MGRWEDMWRQPSQGFHQNEINAHLVEHIDWLTRSGTEGVLVPLCGRSLDLEWLADRFATVLGVELVESPVRRFFEERGIVPQRTPAGALERWSGGGFTLLVGDMLDVTPAEAGLADALYDRAALIALPTDIRRRYADRVSALVRPGASGLLVTLSYDQTAAPGPPFSVPADEVRTLFAGWDLRVVERVAPRSLPPKFDGLEVEKTVWFMERKSEAPSRA